MNKSQEMYGRLASVYRKYAEKRRRYLYAVDSLVIERAPKPSESLLDVGAGDGRRAEHIATELGIQSVTLIDNCHEMICLCQRYRPWRVIEASIEDFTDYSTCYDLITCLWNVVGHIETEDKRKAALGNLRFLLKAGGRLFLDVNNRYNVRAYGAKTVIQNLLMDAITGTEQSGDIAFRLQVEQQDTPAFVHLHSPGEIETLLRAAGLTIVQRYVIDYATGKRCRSVFRGQLIYELTA
jgi:2-polyprenyl-3-methyl-5-hydroxy-6-metoxy-1,4-benzoquinol methylase